MSLETTEDAVDGLAATLALAFLPISEQAYFVSPKAPDRPKPKVNDKSNKSLDKLFFIFCILFVNKMSGLN